MRMDFGSVAAAILHDTIEDTPLTREEIEARFGEEIADFNTAFSVSFELERRREGRARFTFGFQIFHWQHFTFVLRQGGFGIKGVHMRRSAVAEKMYYALRGAGEVRDMKAGGRLCRSGGCEHSA